MTMMTPLTQPEEFKDEDSAEEPLSFFDEEFGDATSSNLDKSGTSGRTSTAGGSDGGGEDHVNDLHAAETTHVNCSKMIVYLVLLVAAASVSTVAYLLLSGEQETTMIVEVSS